MDPADVEPRSPFLFAMVHTDAIARQHVGCVPLRHQPFDSSYFEGLVTIFWLIQSHPQSGTASAKTFDE